MTYELENISEQDQQKILGDASYDPKIVDRFVNRRFFSDPRNVLKWAIDRGRDIYLFRAQNFAREVDNEYHFFYHGIMYTVRVIDSAASQKATTILRHHEKVESVPKDIKQELTDLFAIYGLHGIGPCGMSGKYNSSFSVVPVFEGMEKSA